MTCGLGQRWLFSAQLLQLGAVEGILQNIHLMSDLQTIAGFQTRDTQVH